MQKLTEICIRRPVFATMIVLSLVVVGTAGYLHLGMDRFPSVDLPVVRINARLTGASPAEMESEASQSIEEVVNISDSFSSRMWGKKTSQRMASFATLCPHKCNA